MNTRLEDTNAELRLELNNSGDAAVALQRELNKETEHCERFRRCNTRLLNEHNKLCYSIASLEMKLVETEASTTESSTASEKCFEVFCSKIIGDLAHMCEAYEPSENNGINQTYG
jgi:DNA repair exonuclease SbcCD ATPase subunit